MKNTRSILWCSILAGVCFEYLFFKNELGLNIIVFTLLVLSAGLYLGFKEKITPKYPVWVLIALVIIFSALFVIRKEPLTSFTNFVSTLGLLVLLALTYNGEPWFKFSFSDLVVHPIRFFLGILQGGFYIISNTGKPAPGLDGASPGHTRKIKFWPVIRGLLLAFPIIVLFTALLSSADPIFSKELNDILNLARWAEFAQRGIMVLVTAYLLCGVFYFAITRSKEIKLIGVEKPVVSPFLGMTETAVILGSINILFILFVSVQFRYFFGGQANIQIDGYTYAEYARRGFNELVTVAFLSMVIYSILCSISKRDLTLTRKFFSILGLTLFALIAVMLVSGYQRLLLYEAAYGFSRLRTYTHVFMVWMGLLLLTFIILEITHRQRAFALAVLVAFLGFTLTLNIVNVDGFIASQNISRAENGANLDTNYLYQLYDDAIPNMFSSFQATTNPQIRDQLGKTLACWKSAVIDGQDAQDWRSYNLSRSITLQLFSNNAASLKPYEVKSMPNGTKFVQLNGVDSYCLEYD